MHKLTIRKIGNSAGVILPKEALQDLKVNEGDVLILTRTPDGLALTPYDETVAKGMEAFERTRRKYRNALRELAK